MKWVNLDMMHQHSFFLQGEITLKVHISYRSGLMVLMLSIPETGRPLLAPRRGHEQLEVHK